MTCVPVVTLCSQCLRQDDASLWHGNCCLQVIGEAAVPLDGRFACVRSRESNLANLCCDALREACR